MIIVVDGPEKAGKTTFIDLLMQEVRRTGGFRSMEVRYVKWGALDDGKWAVDATYAAAMAEAADYPGLTIWDRSWASEAVYGQLLQRDRRLASDPWLGEWLYGRGADLKLMLLGTVEEERMAADRTPDDLPVGVHEERVAFGEYGRRFGWTVVPDNRTSPACTRRTVDMVVARVRHNEAIDQQDPRLGCGSVMGSAFRNPKVVIVGERASEHESIPGGWLPFSTRYTEKYGRVLGDDAFRVTWTNAWDDQRHLLVHARLAIACGATAADWVKEVQRSWSQARSVRMEQLYHPAALYRWGRLAPYIPVVEYELRSLVMEQLRDHTATVLEEARSAS